MLWDGNRQVQDCTDTHMFTTVYEQNSFEPVARMVWLKDELLKAANDEIKNAERESWEDEPKLIPSMQVFHYHNDHLGTPNELTNQKGEVVWLADYEAWGNTAKVVWREEKLEQLQVSVDELQPIRFQGQYFDTETGLHYNRFRYFDPDLGMFTTRDPIGLMGGTNVFQYAPNPTGWIDPLGLRSKAYTCPDGAAKNALNSVQAKSIRLNKEYGGLIYEKGGKYFHTIPIPGTQSTFKPILALPQVPKGANIVGDYHTHGAYSRRNSKGQLEKTTAGYDTEDSDNFSKADKRITMMAQAQNPCHRSYLGTPSGKLKASSLTRGSYEL